MMALLPILNSPLVKPIGFLAIVALVYFYAHAKGVHQERTRNAAVTLDIAKRDAVVTAAVVAKVDEKQVEKQVVFKRITKYVDRIVEKPVYRECKLDGDGLRAWNSANEGSTGGIDSPVPDSADLGVPRNGGDAPKPSRGH